MNTSHAYKHSRHYHPTAAACDVLKPGREIKDKKGNIVVGFDGKETLVTFEVTIQRK